jgi:hypothetical protein
MTAVAVFQVFPEFCQLFLVNQFAIEVGIQVINGFQAINLFDLIMLVMMMLVVTHVTYSSG